MGQSASQIIFHLLQEAPQVAQILTQWVFLAITMGWLWKRQSMPLTHTSTTWSQWSQQATQETIQTIPKRTKAELMLQR